jgi:hypothetical protein
MEYVAQMRTTLKVLGCLDMDTIDPAARDALLQTFRLWQRL